MNFPKALIIGLGGLGSDIVCSTYERFKNHSVHEEDQNRVKFLALDTDANEIHERRKIMPPENVIQTSATTDKVAGQFIDEIKNISTVTDWFPVETSELTQMSINDGAGQIRSISRLAFSHAIHKGKIDRIKNAITELLDVSAGEGNIIEVHIVTSLAGGTGAGSFLQTAYLVRELLIRNNITNPKVLGYFMLGDIFLKDPSINLSDPTKTTNILANTYACLKELNGIYEIPEDKKIEFEYGYFSKPPYEITKNNSVPFMQCFLCDYENNEGNNISSISNYKSQIEDFLYLNAFSPTGPKTRSQVINNIFNLIQSGSSSRYGSTGISKIVYPVANLLDYFSVKRLNDNLKTTWLKIDKDFDDKYQEYVESLNKGIIVKEPKLSEFFINSVDAIAKNGMGTEQAVFKSIWVSTKLIDEEKGDVIGNKTDALLYEIMNYIQGLRDSDEDIKMFSKVHHNDSFTSKDKDEANDLNNIKQVEDQLETLKRETFSFIEDSKRIAIDEIFVSDNKSFGKYNEQARYRINTYILQKEKAMHPLAQRYFFYELLHKLENNYEQLKHKNKDLLARITKYNVIYDVKNEHGEEDAHIESASDAYRIYLEEDKGLLKRFSRLTGSPSQLSEFKKEYVSKSNRQAKNLNEYALTKLQEYVFDGLIFQIKKTLENLESLFKTIPAVMVSLQNRMNALSAINNDNDSSIINVLANQNHRDFIFDNIIAKKDTIFFPEEISRNIYEEIFERTCKEIENPMFYAFGNSENRIKDIFEQMVVEKQKDDFKTTFKDDFAGYNVVEAMRKHAELDGENPIEFMKMCCNDAVRRATPFGAVYGSDKPKVNAWAFHPECVAYENLTPDEADTLFNNKSEAQENASRVASDYFDRTEIIREETVMVLSVPENYPKFGFVDGTKEYSTSYEGVYYTYYQKRMKEIQNNPNLPSPHLDKRWISPMYFRDLGVNENAYKKRILRAYFWGLSQSDITSVNNHGSNVWAYNNIDGTGLSFFKGSNGRPIRDNIRVLVTEGLQNNEKIIGEINTKATRKIQEAKEMWREIRAEGRSILTLPLIRDMKNFTFNNSNKNLLSIFNGYITDNDSETVSYVVDEIIETILTITENKGKDTKQMAVDILSHLTKEIPEENTSLTKGVITNMINNKLHKVFNA